MAKDTKQRILRAALGKFNELGYFNVRLQDIADDAKMSVGNMAYHYQNKTQLFDLLFKEWRKSKNLILADLHLVPIFENFNIYLQRTFDLQQQFRFVYFDQLELVRMSSNVAKVYQEHFQNNQEQLGILLALYRARGVLSLQEDKVQMLARKLRRVMDTLMIQQFVEGKEIANFHGFQASIWSELQPFLTESGWQELEAENRKTTI